MSNTQKPPMVVTLNNMGTAVVKPREYYDRHTYVHLDQFMAEVGRRERASGDFSFAAIGAAFMELVKEIKEGKS